MSSSDRHNGGCAVVTGGTRGIGAAIVERLGADGWSTVAIGRNGGEVRADVADAEAVERAFTEIEAAHGAPLVLVNNAGERRDGLAIRMPAADWDAVLATNLTGAFHCTRRALPGMLKARWGRIVNVSSVVAEHANPGQANYAASKAGLLALTRTIAREMARKGITCNAVTPGVVKTDMTSGLVEDLAAAVPTGRAGTPEEVAACVAFLCSEGAGYVNGATLAVDGALAA
jgi:3-oxoacyl-[acyl-carrier protein] reductase